MEFLTDGGDSMRELPRDLAPESGHLLDWFHITMRLTVMGRMTRMLGAEKAPAPEQGAEEEKGPEGAEPEKRLERLKWNLWHGNVYRALQITENLEDDLASRDEPPARSKKLHEAVREFQHYIESDWYSISNYRDLYRPSETIATSFVESTVNQAISKRMVKQQLTRWTERGAHLLLQVRTRALNEDLREMFQKWYPGMEAGLGPVEDAAS
jgi:hypothetical protein